MIKLDRSAIDPAVVSASMQWPGFGTLETVTPYLDYLRRVLVVTGFISGISTPIAGATGYLVYRYSKREKQLEAEKRAKADAAAEARRQEEAEERRKESERFAEENKALRAMIPTPPEMATVVLEVSDTYDHEKKPSGVSCLTKDGKSIHPSQAVQLPVGLLDATCRATGYRDQHVEVQITKGTKTVPVKMEQETGALAVDVQTAGGTYLQTIGLPVYLDGKHETDAMTLPTRQLKAGREVKVFIGGSSWTTQADGHVWGEKWAASEPQTVTVKGGVVTTLKFIVPVEAVGEPPPKK